MKKEDNAFKAYVESRLQELILKEIEASDVNKQPVTVRLGTGQVRMIDALAKELELSRQTLLQDVIRTGITQVAKAYADTHGDKAQEVYLELLKHTEIQAEDL